MEAALHSESAASPSVTWSTVAGLYAFAWGVTVSVLLSDIVRLFSEVVGLPGSYWMAVVASPALLVGAGVWWMLVERRGSYGYAFGALFGLVTALVVSLLWTAWFVSVWGVEMLVVPMVATLAAIVVGLVAVAGTAVGLPMMYLRRRFGREGVVRE